MSTGDIRNGPYATRAKEYVWSTIADAFPRGITPTDIDGMVELNWCFFLFEGKTEGKSLDKGQQLALRRHLMSLPHGKAVAVIGTHGPLDRVDTAHLNSVRFGWSHSNTIEWSGLLPGCIKNVADCFVRDATHGALLPETWYDECQYAMRPFEASL